MITSRTRAVVLLAATLVVGGVIGGAVTRASFRAQWERWNESRGPRRGGWPGYSWLRDHQPDSVLVARLDSTWNQNECITDSIQRTRVGVQIESLSIAFRPILESLRVQNRNGIRSILPDSLRAKYDSLNAASDSSRRKMWDQRNSNGGSCSEAWMRGSGPRNGGPPGGGRGGRGPN